MGDAELHRDEHRGAQGGEPDEVGPAGHEREAERERDGERLDRALWPREVVQPPDREGRAAAVLERDRPVPEPGGVVDADGEQRGGVIGVKKEQAIQSLVDQMGIRFETSEDDPWLMGALVDLAAPSIVPVRRPWTAGR